MKNRIFGILPHLCIVLAVMLLTFFVTDRFNRAMAFINNDITKWLLAVFCVLAIFVSVLLIIRQRRDK